MSRARDSRRKTTTKKPAAKRGEKAAPRPEAQPNGGDPIIEQPDRESLSAEEQAALASANVLSMSNEETLALAKELADENAAVRLEAKLLRIKLGTAEKELAEAKDRLAGYEPVEESEEAEAVAEK